VHVLGQPHNKTKFVLFDIQNRRFGAQQRLQADRPMSLSLRCIGALCGLWPGHSALRSRGVVTCRQTDMPVALPFLCPGRCSAGGRAGAPSVRGVSLPAGRQTHVCVRPGHGVIRGRVVALLPGEPLLDGVAASKRACTEAEIKEMISEAECRRVRAGFRGWVL
jgi:hypothetical protein